MRGLGGAVERILAGQSLSSAQCRLGFLQICIGGLGDVSNVFGRQVTNDVAKQIGARIADTTSGQGAVIGRITATDFAVILPHADTARSEHVADALAQALMIPIDVDGVVFSVRPTIAVATAPADGSDLDALTARAEIAIMDARREGAVVEVVRNRDEREARRRLDLLVDLRNAIEEPEHASELSVHYQPQVRISDGHLVGVEALVRWRHPDRGLADTADMITTAEAGGVISMLTLRILDDVLAQLATWSAVGRQLRVSVNVSAKDLASPRFAEHVEQRLSRHSIAAEHLGLEVTETALVVSTTVDRTIADLAAIGVDLSLDDFGTGYTSIQQLRRYPLRELKIDRSYIGAMTTSHADRAVITSMSRLATELGPRVVAEGVEDAATSTALERLGPIIGQGWYYGRPMTAPDLITWIDTRMAALSQPAPSQRNQPE